MSTRQPSSPAGSPGGSSGTSRPRFETPKVDLENPTVNAWIGTVLAERGLLRVEPNMGRSGDLVDQARSHVRSARALAALDSTLALAACHDAIRRALDAHAGASGYRFENSLGAHRTAIAYGREVLGHLIDAGDLDDAERLRSRRHNAEYGEVPAAQIHETEVVHYASVAERTVRAAAVANDLAGKSS